MTIDHSSLVTLRPMYFNNFKIRHHGYGVIFMQKNAIGKLFFLAFF